MTAEQIKGILFENYSKPDWMGFAELKEGILDHSRRIDFFAISCHKTQGFGYSIAFEIKVDRLDFERELISPGKRKPFMEVSNEFYFVTPKGLLSLDEIPEGCGLIEIWGDGLHKLKYAQQRLNLTYPPEFVASILNRVSRKNPLKWKIFKYAGEELSYEDVQNIIEEKLKEERDYLLQRAYSSAKGKLLEEDKLKYDELIGVLGSYIRFRKGSEIEDIKEALKNRDIEMIKSRLQDVLKLMEEM